MQKKKAVPGAKKAPSAMDRVKLARDPKRPHIYDFIKFVSEESLIDKKDFERKLKTILKRGRFQ